MELKGIQENIEKSEELKYFLNQLKQQKQKNKKQLHNTNTNKTADKRL